MRTMSTMFTSSTTANSPSRTPPLSPSLQGSGAYQLPIWASNNSHIASSTSQSASSTNSTSTSIQTSSSTMNTSVAAGSISHQTNTSDATSTIVQNTAISCPPSPTSPPSSPPIPPGISSSTHSKWDPQGLSSRVWQFLHSIDQGPLQYVIAPGKRLGRRLKKFLSFDKSTVILSFILVVIFGIPAWRSLNLQIWTSRKDFLEYCIDESAPKSVSAQLDCDKAIKAGLPPPPGRIKRVAKISNRSIAGSSQQLVSQPKTVRRSVTPPGLGSLPQSDFLEPLFEVSSRHLVLTLLFWFGVSILLVTQIRKTTRKFRWSYRHGHRRSIVPLLHLISVTTFITELTLYVVLEHYRWVDIKQAEAEVAYYRYCHRLPRPERLSTCTERAMPNAPSSTVAEWTAWDDGSYAEVLKLMILASLIQVLITAVIIPLIGKLPRVTLPICDSEAAQEAVPIELRETSPDTPCQGGNSMPARSISAGNQQPITRPVEEGQPLDISEVTFQESLFQEANADLEEAESSHGMDIPEPSNDLPMSSLVDDERLDEHPESFMSHFTSEPSETSLPNNQPLFPQFPADHIHLDHGSYHTAEGLNEQYPGWGDPILPINFQPNYMDSNSTLVDDVQSVPVDSPTLFDGEDIDMIIFQQELDRLFGDLPNMNFEEEMNSHRWPEQSSLPSSPGEEAFYNDMAYSGLDFDAQGQYGASQLNLSVTENRHFASFSTQEGPARHGGMYFPSNLPSNDRHAMPRDGGESRESGRRDWRRLPESPRMSSDEE